MCFRSVVEDYKLAKERTGDKEFDLILQALQLSEEPISYNPEEFIPQMFLRLADVKVTETFTLEVYYCT